MKRLFLLVLLIPSFAAWSQDDEPGMSNIDMTNNTYNNPATIAGSISAATSSGPANCGTVANDDVFYSFTAITQAVKLVLNSNDFDGVLEIWDSTFNSVECTDNTVGIGEENHFFTTLTIGEVYYIRIHSSDGASGGGNFTLEYAHLPNFFLSGAFTNTNISGEPYRLCDQIRRTLVTGLIVEGTLWKFRNLADNSEATYYVNGNLYLTFLDNVEEVVGTLADPFFCYGESFAVSTQVYLEGRPCGFSEERNINLQPEPDTFLLTAYINATYNPDEDFIRAKFSHVDQVMEWELFEFGVLLDSHTTDQGEDRIFINNFDGILYGRYYEIRVRVTSCGVTGSWSPFYNIFTEDIPYINLEEDLCGETFSPSGSSVIWCTTFPLATGFYWQLTPIAMDDPEFTPIGPAIVEYRSSNNLNLGSVPVSNGQYYRVAVKPEVQNGAQVGDYGVFCQILVDAFANFELDEETDSNASSAGLFNGLSNNLNSSMGLHPNPSKGDHILLDLSSNLQNSITAISIFDAYGKTVYHRSFQESLPRKSLRLNDLNIKDSGTYFVVAYSPLGTVTEKLIIE